MKMIPNSRPQQKREVTEALLKKAGADLSKVCLVGVRGYYRDTMGAPGKNDFNIYDDACFLISPTAYVTWNFNVDPVRARPGHGFGGAKGMGHLAPGLWLYQPGIHRGYNAFRQAADVVVYRDADKQVPESNVVVYQGFRMYKEKGQFGVNLHRGGTSTTSSIACNTWPVDQFEGARAIIYGELKRYNQKTFQYLLVDAA